MLREGPLPFGEIVWVCDRCLRVHMWDLLDGKVARARGMTSMAEEA